MLRARGPCASRSPPLAGLCGWCDGSRTPALRDRAGLCLRVEGGAGGATAGTNRRRLASN